MQKLLAGAAALALVAVAAPAFAQTSAQADAKANIITPLMVTTDRNLVFGNILGNGGGTVTIDPTDALGVSSTGVSLLTGVTRSSAHFHVVGDTTGGATYAVTLTKVDLAGPSSSVLPLTITNSTLPTSGTGDIYVGGTINVSGTQTTGQYTGSVTAAAAYN